MAALVEFHLAVLLGYCVRGFPVPLKRLDGVLCDTVAVFGQPTQAKLGVSITLRGGLTEALNRQPIILRHTLAAGVHDAQRGLPSGVAMLRGFPEPLNRFVDVFWIT